MMSATCSKRAPTLPPPATRWRDGRTARWPRLALLLACALLAALPAGAQGLFAQWTQDGVPVRHAPSAATSSKPIPDGRGGTFVVWSDREPGEMVDNLRVQHLLPDGTRDPRWPADGLRVGTANQGWTALSDLADGVYVDVGGLVRVLEDGTVPSAWAAVGGVPLGTHDVLATDFEGGVWSIHSRQGSHCEIECSYWTDFFVVRIDRDGAHVPGWEPPGRLTLTIPGGQYSAGFFGFLGWRSMHGGVRFGMETVRAFGCCNFTSVGICSLTTSMGVGYRMVMAGTADRFNRFEFDSDAHGHDFFQTGAFRNSLLQRAIGAVTWPQAWDYPAGVAPALNPEGVVSDLAGGAFARTVFHAGWLSFPATGRRLNHVLPDGTSNPAWPAGGLSIEGAGVGSQDRVQSIPDGRGGCFLVWQDTRSGTDADIYVLRFATDASTPAGWPATGFALAQVAGSDQTLPGAASDPLGNVFVTWRDTRQGAANIFAQKLNANLPVPAQVRHATARLVERGVELTWDLARPPESALHVERDLGGEGWIELGEPVAALSPGRWTFVDAATRAGRTHAYRLAERSSGWTGGEVSVEVPEAGFSLLGITPNPVSVDSRLTLSSPRDAPVEFEVTDLLGRAVMGRRLETVGIGSYSTRWDELARLPAGLYWLRARQGPATSVVRFVVTR